MPVTLCVQFLSRPFVVGDRIEVTTAGGVKLLLGFVERVDPMRTIIRSDAGLPFMLPNKVRFTSVTCMTTIRKPSLHGPSLVSASSSCVTDALQR